MNHTQRLSSAENGIAMCFKTACPHRLAITYGISLKEVESIIRNLEVEALRKMAEADGEAA